MDDDVCIKGFVLDPKKFLDGIKNAVIIHRKTPTDA